MGRLGFQDKRLAFACAAAGAFTVIAVASDARSETPPPFVSWVGREGGDYEDALLWRSPAFQLGVPAESLPGTSGTFGLGAKGGVASEYAVTLNADASRYALRVVGADMDFRLGGHTLTLTGSSVAPATRDLSVQSLAPRATRLRLENGTLIAPRVHVSQSTGGSSVLEIGDGAELVVGNTLQVTPGATLRLDGGTLTLPASNSFWPDSIDGQFDFVRGTLNLAQDTGGRTLTAGQHINVASPVALAGPLVLNGGSYSAPSISGGLELNSGRLSITNGTYFMGSLGGQNLQAGQTIEVSGDVFGDLNLQGGSLSAGRFQGQLTGFTAGELNITAGGFVGVLPSNQLAAGQTLRVRDAVGTVPSITGGHLSVGQLYSAPASFTAGTLEITGSDLYIGGSPSGPSDSHFAWTSTSPMIIPNGAELVVAGKTAVQTTAPLRVLGRFETGQLVGRVALSTLPADNPELVITDGGLEIGSGRQLSLFSLNRGAVRVSGDVGLFGAVVVNGGAFQAAAFTQDSTGVLDFRSGELRLTDSDVDLSASGGRVTVASIATFDGLPAGALVEISGETKTGDNFTINGGTWRTGTLTRKPNGQIEIRSGTLHITDGDFDLADILHNSRANAVLRVDGTLTDSGSAFEAPIRDLAVIAERIEPGPDRTFRLGDNASLRLTGSDLVIGPHQPLGAVVTLAPTQSLTVDGATTIEPFSALTIDGGSFTTGDLFVRDGGALIFNDGQFTVTGATSISQGAYLDLRDSTITTDRLRLHGGTLGGSGTIDGGLYNDGVVSPGNSPGVIEVEGNYDQYGTLLLELAGLTPGSGHDQLQVAGVATLSGDIELALLDGFEPNPGDVFDVITAESIIDQAFTLSYDESLLFTASIVPAGGGQALRLTFVPEPGVSVFVMAGVGVLLTRRRGGVGM